MKNKHIKIFALSFCCVMLLGLLCVNTWAAEQDTCTHQFSVEIVKEATETQDGLLRYTCDLCGYTYLETLPRTGHIWSAWQTIKEPTCGSEGQQMRVCTKYPDSPHYEYRTMPATGEHQYESHVTQEPDCLHNGEVTYVCAVCGATYTEALPALGHDFGEWITDEEPTMLHTGHAYRVCARDGFMEEITLEKIPGPNSVDYALCSMLAVGVVGLGYPLIPAARVMKWYKGKKEENLKQAK